MFDCQITRLDVPYILHQVGAHCYFHATPRLQFPNTRVRDSTGKARFS